MGEIRFIVELAKRTEYPPELAIPSQVATDQNGTIISTIQTGDPSEGETYWIKWNGKYDTPAKPEMQIYFGNYLQQVSSIAVLISTLNSITTVDANLITHTSRYTWQYPAADTEASRIIGFSSSPREPDNPSDSTYETSIGQKVKYPATLKIPSGGLLNKITDPISGISLLSTFNFEIDNTDGFFDDTNDANYLNVPVSIKKSTANQPKLENFVRIRYGLVDNIQIDFSRMRVVAADVYRTLDQEVCRTVAISDYPAAPNSSVDKPLPVAWGPISGVPLIEVGENQYIVCDPKYQRAVTALYDGDGKSITFAVNRDGIISSTQHQPGKDGPKIIKPKTADITGIPDNRCGQIITNIIDAHGNISYREGPWDKAETDYYVSASPQIGFFFSGGTVKDLVKKVLQNDSAFLVTKNDGSLTIRKWGASYSSHVIPSWMITKRPSKTYIDQKYFASSIVVNYNYEESSKTHRDTVLLNDEELRISEKWRKKKRANFATRLLDKPTANDLGRRLLDRFGNRPEIWKIATGFDSSKINPLDKIELDININGRLMSAINRWIVREVNPAQDTLTLEAVDAVTSIDAELSAPSTEVVDGLLCAVGSLRNDAIIGKPAWVLQEG